MVLVTTKILYYFITFYYVDLAIEAFRFSPLHI